jgi:hypothetical protein
LAHAPWLIWMIGGSDREIHLRLGVMTPHGVHEWEFRANLHSPAASLVQSGIHNICAHVGVVLARDGQELVLPA